MTPDEIQAMARGVAEASGGNAQWIGYLIAVVAGGALSYLGSYLGEKGKGRATKEDVKEITRAVEDVKNEYVRQIEDLKAHHQLRMVAAEKRLSAHQAAYIEWRNLMRAISYQPVSELYEHFDWCRNWYDENCVFLTSSSRAAFKEMVEGAAAYIKECQLGGNDSEGALAQWIRFECAGNVFLEDVSLPGLTSVELTKMKEGGGGVSPL